MEGRGRKRCEEGRGHLGCVREAQSHPEATRFVGAGQGERGGRLVFFLYTLM